MLSLLNKISTTTMSFEEFSELWYCPIVQDTKIKISKDTTNSIRLSWRTITNTRYSTILCLKIERISPPPIIELFQHTKSTLHWAKVYIKYFTTRQQKGYYTSQISPTTTRQINTTLLTSINGDWVLDHLVIINLVVFQLFAPRPYVRYVQVAHLNRQVGNVIRWWVIAICKLVANVLVVDPGTRMLMGIVWIILKIISILLPLITIRIPILTLTQPHLYRLPLTSHGK